ncbi:MAG TPA: hypothetical protein VGF69_13945 [Thermoanaerobaculia bacterium]|jgi:Spy/CpxP family protein refolding chaperone
MTRKWVVAAAMLFAATLANAQQQMPPGKWWRMPKVVQLLQLSATQQSQLDGIFGKTAEDLIDLKAAVEKASLALRGQLDAPRINRTELQQTARRLNEARGRLFEREVLMLADMRAVLSDQQWTRLRAELEQRQRQGPRQGQGQPRRPRP